MSGWTGKITIGAGWAIFDGAVGDQAPHRHHAVQVALGMDAPIKVWVQDQGMLAVRGIVIAAGQAHQLGQSTNAIKLLYLERESGLGRRLDDWCGAPARLLSAKTARRLCDALAKTHETTPSILNDAVALTMGLAKTQGPAPFADHRIARFLSKIPRPVPHGALIGELVQRIGLSPSRFAHLFRAHTGMPLRPYLRWMRLQDAVTAVAHGQTLTDAAHVSGFSDSAHLSRTFQRTFGIAPRILTQRSMSMRLATSHASQQVRSSRHT